MNVLFMNFNSDAGGRPTYRTSEKEMAWIQYMINNLPLIQTTWYSIYPKKQPRNNLGRIL